MAGGWQRAERGALSYGFWRGVNPCEIGPVQRACDGGVGSAGQGAAKDAAAAAPARWIQNDFSQGRATRFTDRGWADHRSNWIAGTCFFSRECEQVDDPTDAA